MRSFFLLILFFTSFYSSSQTIINWDPEITVADGSVYGNTRPRIALAANNVPVVIYGKISGGKLFTSRFNGVSFDLPIGILPASMSSYLATWTGPDIAAKGDTVIAVFKQNPMDLGNVYAVRSVDGGITFSDTIRVDNHIGGISWMPSLDIDENGNPSVVYMAHDASMTNPRYNVVHSTDQGISYQPEMEIATSIPGEACDCCPAEYVIDGAQHALLFRNNDANIRDIYAVYSNDDGLTYPENANVDNLNWAINACPSTGPHGMFNNGSLYTVSASRATGSFRVYISETATNPSFSVQTNTMMIPPTNATGVQNYPRITGENDTIIMVWQEAETSNYEIYTGFTTTGTISEIVNSKTIVNDSLFGSQTNPDVIYANGKVYVVFQDAISGDVIYKSGTIGTLSIKDKELDQYAFYPNPNKEGTFYLDSPIADLKNCNITTLNGQKCEFKISTIGDKTVIKLDKIVKGIYFFNFIVDGVEKTNELIIE